MDPRPDSVAADTRADALVAARYDRFFADPAIAGFVARGGRVFIATEGRSTTAVQALLHLGHRHFAEKYVQETAHKWPQLRASHPDVRLHDFGRLQSNKVAAALRLFDAIESVDRPRLAATLGRQLAIARHWAAGGSAPALYLQVNLGAEPQKGGVVPEHAEAFAAHCHDELGLRFTGVMAIPPRLAPPAPHFRALRRLADRLHLAECVMGMSDDHGSAIACGSTAIRIGRAILGPLPH